MVETLRFYLWIFNIDRGGAALLSDNNPPLLPV